jgi:uncharacterized protein YegP (UPF0339 family)
LSIYNHVCLKHTANIVCLGENFLPKPKLEIYKDQREEYRWRLKAENGQIIAEGGQGYSSKAKCEQGIEAVKHDIRLAKMEDLTIQAVTVTA